MTVTDVNAATDDASPQAINTSPHASNSTTAPDADTTTAENSTSVRQLLDGQEYPVAKGDIIKKSFNHKSAVEQCMAYLHGLYQLLVFHIYTGDRITSFTCLKILPIDNNAMLGAAQFMVVF